MRPKLIKPAPKLQLSLTVDVCAPSLGRSALRTWLVALGWPPTELDTLLVAAGEALANAVDHAYPEGSGGPVHLTAEPRIDPDGHDHVVLTVSDEGTWRPIPADPGNRGHGLRLMRSFTATTTVETTPTGTRVTMISHPRPDPRAAQAGTPDGADRTTTGHTPPGTY